MISPCSPRGLVTSVRSWVVKRVRLSDSQPGTEHTCRVIARRGLRAPEVRRQEPVIQPKGIHSLINLCSNHRLRYFLGSQAPTTGRMNGTHSSIH